MGNIFSSLYDAGKKGSENVRYGFKKGIEGAKHVGNKTKQASIYSVDESKKAGKSIFMKYKSFLFLFIILFLLEVLQLVPSSSMKAQNDYYLYIAFFLTIIVALVFTIFIPRDLKESIVILIPCITMYIPIFAFLFAKSKIQNIYNKLDEPIRDKVHIMDSSDSNILICNSMYIGITFFFSVFVFRILLNKESISDVFLAGKYTQILLVSSILFIMVQIFIHFLFEWYKNKGMKTTDDGNIMGLKKCKSFDNLYDPHKSI